MKVQILTWGAVILDFYLHMISFFLKSSSKFIPIYFLKILALDKKNLEFLPTYCSSFSEFQNFIYDDSYIGLPQPRIAAGARQQAGALCPIYESSYIKIFNSENELII